MTSIKMDSQNKIKNIIDLMFLYKSINFLSLFDWLYERETSNMLCLENSKNDEEIIVKYHPKNNLFTDKKLKIMTGNFVGNCYTDEFFMPHRVEKIKLDDLKNNRTDSVFLSMTDETMCRLFPDNIYYNNLVLTYLPWVIMRICKFMVDLNDVKLKIDSVLTILAYFKPNKVFEEIYDPNWFDSLSIELMSTIMIGLSERVGYDIDRHIVDIFDYIDYEKNIESINDIFKIEIYNLNDYICNK